jgi:signal transduction histidine kinase
MSHDDLAIDPDGRVLPYRPDEVRQIVLRMIDQGEILFVGVRVGDDLAVQAFAPPSQDLVDALEQAAHAIREALRRAS